MRLLPFVVLMALTTPAVADQKAAEKLFRAGERSYKAQKFLSAARNFEEAYKELPAPEIAFSAAQAYRRQYRVDPDHAEYAELAVKYYKIYLNDAKDSGTRLGDAADSLGEMARVLERVGTTGKLTTSQEKKTQLGVSIVLADAQVATKPSGMHEVDDDKDDDKADDKKLVIKASIDGKPVDLDTLTDVSPGDHTIHAEADGYLPADQPAHIAAGSWKYEDVTLRPKPANVTVKTEAGAAISVDHLGMGTAPRAPLQIEGGTHVITVTRLGRRPVAREIRVTRDQQLTLDVDLEATTRRRAVPWVIGVGGGVTLGFTGFFLIGAKYADNRASDRLAELMTGNQDRSVLDNYNTWRHRRDLAINLAIVSGGAAVAVGLTAAWMYYFDTPSAEGVTVTPWTSREGAGAAVSGRF
ncbi:MAG TPA: PEGA domain-containing protein [Kofleriaceae bacterium]|nr:PEGA domain-containing protein [Kofleriaceae bacterium]